MSEERAPTFRDLNLTKQLWNAIDDMGLVEPTRIQMAAVPAVMSGRDVVGIAQTGTGKTLAYLLPALRQWKFAKHAYPQILIVVPTRELVEQVVEQIEMLTKYMTVVTIGIYGGSSILSQQQTLQDGLDVLVATPGRLLDIMLTGTIQFRHLRKLIIDEIDEMLELGFRPQLMNLLDLLPGKRQNCMFSATMTEDVKMIIEDIFNFPEYVTAARSGTPLKMINQLAYPAENFYTKVNLLEHILADAERFERVLVFAPNKRLADVVYNRLEVLFPGHSTVIHGNKAQNARFRALRNFQSGDKRILVATDLVSRGLDIEDISHVISMNAPGEPENYIHRIGRTGRMEKKGESILFFTQKELGQVANIEGLMRTEIERLEFPEGIEVSQELTPEETPQIYMPTLETKLKETGGAFHEKGFKASKTNRGNAKTRKLKAKMSGKPGNTGKKRF
ncbi:MAG: DEAD/DEAH box helicase [Saprospiraceae bacterium]